MTESRFPIAFGISQILRQRRRSSALAYNKLSSSRSRLVLRSGEVVAVTVQFRSEELGCIFQCRRSVYIVSFSKSSDFHSGNQLHIFYHAAHLYIFWEAAEREPWNISLERPLYAVSTPPFLPYSPRDTTKTSTRGPSKSNSHRFSQFYYVCFFDPTLACVDTVGRRVSCGPHR